MRSRLLAIALVIAFAGCGPGQPPGAAQDGESPAPDFAVETFSGDTFSLADHRGTPVVINFWESW